MNTFPNYFLKTVVLGLALGSTLGAHASEPVGRFAGLQQTAQAFWQGSVDTVKTVASPFIVAAQNPIITGVVVFGSLAAYVAFVRSASQNWKSVLEKAEAITRPMTDPILLSERDLLYWGYATWQMPSDITQNSNAFYAALKAAKMNKNEDECSFIRRMINEFDAEKEKLKPVRIGLSSCLAACRLMPKLEITKEINPYNRVLSIIDVQKKMRGLAGKKLNELSTQEVFAIHDDIIEQSSASIFNPYKAMRHWALPAESEAMREYWKIHILMERINTVTDYLNKKLSPAPSLLPVE